MELSFLVTIVGVEAICIVELSVEVFFGASQYHDSISNTLEDGRKSSRYLCKLHQSERTSCNESVVIVEDYMLSVRATVYNLRIREWIDVDDCSTSILVEVRKLPRDCLYRFALHQSSY